MARAELDIEGRLNALARRFAKDVARLGVDPVTALEAFASYTAENEGGRGGVYAYDIRNDDGILMTVVLAPAEED